MRSGQCETLEEMLRGGDAHVRHTPQPAQEAVLYYEAIDLPLPEFENLVTFKVSGWRAC